MAGIKHTNNETDGMAILTSSGIGAMQREKIMKPARAGYWMSNQVHLWRRTARIPSMGLKEVCNLVMLVIGSSYCCLLGFFQRDLLSSSLPDRCLSGILILSAPGHCRCGMCSFGLAWVR